MDRLSGLYGPLAILVDLCKDASKCGKDDAEPCDLNIAVSVKDMVLVRDQSSNDCVRWQDEEEGKGHHGSCVKAKTAQQHKNMNSFLFSHKVSLGLYHTLGQGCCNAVHQ